MPSRKKPKRKHAQLHSWATINRAAAVHTARFDLGAAYDILDVDADFALNVLQQSYAIRAATRPSLTSFAALLAFHRSAELLDGLSVLAKAGCAETMTPIVRTMFESVMYARYLMTVNDERIAAAYLVSQPLAKVAHIEAQAAEHAGGSAPTIYGRESRAVVENMIADDRLFREARTELARLHQASSVPAPWYEAFDGPRTLGGMSGRVDDSTLERYFDFYYDRWSAAAHACDTMSAMSTSFNDVDEIEELFAPLRTPSRRDLRTLVRTAHDLFTLMLTHHLNYFREIPEGMTEYRELEGRLHAALVSGE